MSAVKEARDYLKKQGEGDKPFAMDALGAFDMMVGAVRAKFNREPSAREVKLMLAVIGVQETLEHVAHGDDLSNDILQKCSDLISLSVWEFIESSES